MAERGGFEPPVELPLLRFSRPISLVIFSITYPFSLVCPQYFHFIKFNYLHVYPYLIYQHFLS
ncbi:hypothetical protein ELZ97_09270 [Salmonella enterica subsp. enterica serovar Stanleyville]|nr:hypothetical protein EL006_09295 [Salmonella enterica subsp. enterica serovar Stanleyville]EAM3049989.1 hypothetical protein [Salmonella enterica]AZT63798.1 hypothetical protein ELZ97_09270 [Salmonella enterica subsp. enterica serovar Stanleyville]AZT67968.1 hypothetical protein ELZ68_09265 [Salmonella enterica subsp. enterica serovar Stanleyville]EAA7189276.1 hypothetical protein [Salmonella enterica subsp. enterica serovar Stanleyville]